MIRGIDKNTKYDLKVMVNVNSYGVMNTAQMILVIGGSASYLVRRLKKLTEYERIVRLNQRLWDGNYIYKLGKEGARILASLEITPIRRVFSFHTFYRSQVRATLISAFRAGGIELNWFPEDRRLGRIYTHYKEGGKIFDLNIVPDDFFTYNDKFYFVEMDLSAKPKTFTAKLQGYEKFWKLGDNIDLYFRQFTLTDFMVLSVFDTKERMESARKAFSKVSKNNIFLFSYLDKFNLKNPQDSLGEWRTPSGDKIELLARPS